MDKSESIKLTVKQEKFVNLYVELGNASEAYRRSYSCKNMSDSTVWENASRLVSSSKVSARIRQLQAELQSRYDVRKDEAVRELTNILRGRLTNVLEVKGDSIKIKELQKLPDEVVSCIESVKETSTGIEVKLYNKIQAIGSLRAMMGWDEPTKQELTDKGANKIVVEVIDSREGVKDGSESDTN